MCYKLCELVLNVYINHQNAWKYRTISNLWGDPTGLSLCQGVILRSMCCCADMSLRTELPRSSLHRSSGSQFWRPRLRPAIRTCCSRMRATPSPTSRTWAQSSAVTSAQKSWSSLHRKRLPYATSPLSPSLGAFI